LKDSIVRVLLVDDFGPWLNLVQTYLGHRPNIHILDVATDGSEALRKAEELQPDLILLDVGLPKMNGIEAAARIQKCAPKCAMVFLSQCADPDVVRAAFKAGGSGYVLKSDATKDLMDAIATVLRGELFASHTLMDLGGWN
jgi:DNA-binding NarL/FixJ family response regulator